MALALAIGSATAFAVAVPSDAAHAFQKKDKKKKGEAEAPSYDLSDEYRAQVIKVQELLAGTDNAATASAIAMLEGLTVKEDEKYLTGQMMLGLSAKNKDKALQNKGLELSLQSSRISQQDRGYYNFVLGESALINNEDYMKAQGYFAKALEQGYETAGMMNQYAEAKFSEAIAKSGGKTITAENDAIAKEGLKYLARAIELPDTNNILDENRLYKRGVNIALAINSPEVTTWANNYLNASPSADSWYTALSILRNQAKYDDQKNLDLMRLMRRANAMQTAGDYAEYAENADPGSLPGEVSSVLEEGVAAGKVDASDTFFSEIMSQAKGNIADDRDGLPSAEKSARSSDTGRTALATADAYLAYGEAEKAVELYQLALDKGQIENDRALTRLGIANVDLGNYDAARDAFSKVQGPRKPLADLWMLWVDQKNSPAQAAPAA